MKDLLPVTAALGLVAWAFYDQSPEALLAAVDAFPAQVVVCNAVAVIEEERPFQFSLFAHSWHGKRSCLDVTAMFAVKWICCNFPVSFSAFFASVSPVCETGNIGIGIG
jgi:hypothetical protein